jgi:lysozyme family protein
MVASNFPAALRLVLKHEGGFSKHPADPGGATMLGVTKKVWEAYTGETVTEGEMKQLTPEDVGPLYKRGYWDKCRCDDLPSGLDYAVFDYAVNSGVMRASKVLQATLDVVTDGMIGPATIAAARASEKVIQRYCGERLRFLKALPHWPSFGKGWERRVREVQAKALSLEALPDAHAAMGESVRVAIQRATAPRSGGR